MNAIRMDNAGNNSCGRQLLRSTFRRRGMRLARWVHSRPAPAEGETQISTEQVSLLGGLDRDMQEGKGQDGEACGNRNTH